MIDEKGVGPVVPGLNNVREWALKAADAAAVKEAADKLASSKKNLREALLKHLGLTVEPEGESVIIEGIEFRSNGSSLQVHALDGRTYGLGGTGDQAWAGLGSIIRKIEEAEKKAAEPKPAQASAPVAEKQLTAEERLLKALRVIIADEIDANAG